MATLPNDAQWLAAAARLAARGRPLSRPNPAVGALIVKHGIVLGRGWTQRGGRPHAEAMALAQAGELARGATLYCTLEPCNHPSGRGPTCSALIAQSGIARLVYGVQDPDERTAGAGAQSIREAGITVSLIDSAPSRDSLAGYLSQRCLQRPHVTLKLAMTLDGFIAMTSGESRWITGPEARAHVHSRRAMADAILVGGGTWRIDKPQLNVRLDGLEDRSPRRILLSRGTASEGVQVIDRPHQISTLEGIQYLYIEGGAQTAASFLKAGLVDRIELYRAPVLLGSGIPALGDLGLASLDDAHGQWRLAERRVLGSDTFEAYERVSPSTGKGE